MFAKYLLLPVLFLTRPALAVPTIQHWITENGTRVYFVPAHELPMVDVQVVFDGGSARDEALPGLARFTNSLLQEGAGELDADAVAERLATLGAELNTDSARDMASVSLRTLAEPAIRDQAVELLALLLARPTFAPQALERVRGQLLVRAKQEHQSPADLAIRIFYKGIFHEHPYATPPGGAQASLLAITAADVQQFYRHYYVARNAVLVMVGDLERREAEALADKVIGQLPAGEAAPRVPPAPAVSKAAARTIAFPSVQTHILVGQPAISRLDDDYYALNVGNHVLGGSGLISLLAEEIRERRGLAYSVESYFKPMRAEGPYILSLQTRNEKAGEALELLHSLLHQFVTVGPTEAQLQAAKKNITGGFPLRIDSNRKILDYVSMIGFYGLPLDYLERFNARIAAVTVEDVRSAFARHIHPQRLVTVMVGTDEKTASGVPTTSSPAPPLSATEPSQNDASLP